MGLLNGKVFFLIMTFSFIETLMFYVRMFLPIILLGGATEYITILVWIFDAYSFLLSFVLFFIVFYRACGKIIQKEPASVIITLIIGGFVGTWIGGLAAVPTLTWLGAKNFDLTASLRLLPIIMQSAFVGNFLFATAAMLWSWFVLKWNEKLAETSFQTNPKAPFDIALVSALFVFSGILSLFVLPLIGIALSILNAEWSLPLLAALTPLMLVNAGAQIAIAAGLYRGKRWGWILAFIAALTGICIQINSAIVYFKYPWLFALAITALALNVMVVMLLLTVSSRQHCRIINPTKAFQQTEA